MEDLETLILSVLRGATVDIVAAEAESVAKPLELRHHAVLAAYYEKRCREGEQECAARALEHVKFLIEHAPATPVLPMFLRSAGVPSEISQELRNTWLRVGRSSTDPAAVVGAMRYLAEELSLVEELLGRIRELNPTGPFAYSVAARIFSEYAARGAVELWGQALTAYEEALVRSGSVFQREGVIGDAAYAAWRARSPAAEALAREAITATSFNTEGNRHCGHNVLGLLALARDDISEAERHLLASVPQGPSFYIARHRPVLDLARRLLERGRNNAVSEFLTRIRTAWPQGQSLIAQWTSEIQTTGRSELGVPGSMDIATSERH